MARIHRRPMQKKSLNYRITTMVWSFAVELDILGCKVKWASGIITMNKASGGDGTLAELFQIVKDDAVKVLLSICQRKG